MYLHMFTSCIRFMLSSVKSSLKNALNLIMTLGGIGSPDRAAPSEEGATRIQWFSLVVACIYFSSSSRLTRFARSPFSRNSKNWTALVDSSEFSPSPPPPFCFALLAAIFFCPFASCAEQNEARRIFSEGRAKQTETAKRIGWVG